MSKEEKKAGADLTKAAPQAMSQVVQDLTKEAQKLATATPKEQLRALEDLMGVDSADVEVIAAGKLPFWPAYAGAVIKGTIQNRREVATQYKTPQNPNGVVGLYTLRVEDRPCMGATLDGEVFEVQPGENITVLERAVMEELRTRIGQKVAILCVGKQKGRTFSYWDYKIVGQKRSAEEIQAASQLAMANLQARQLGAHSGDE